MRETLSFKHLSDFYSSSLLDFLHLNKKKRRRKPPYLKPQPPPISFLFSNLKKHQKK